MQHDLFTTVLSGTAVASLAYLLKQFLDYFFFNRWAEYHQVRGRSIETAIFISHFVSNLPPNPKEDVIKIWINASQEARRDAGALITFARKKHFLLFGVPQYNDLIQASSAMLGLARCSRETDGKKATELAATIIKVFNAGNDVPTAGN